MVQTFIIFLLLISSILYLTNKFILKRGANHKEGCAECGPLRKTVEHP